MEACEPSLLVLALGALLVGSSFETQIIGGREVIPHSRPYMASLQRGGSHLCGGVLVHPKWVLTAAHCLVERTAQLRLVLGLHALSGPGLTFHIKAAVQHPRYKPAPALENDLALLQVCRDGTGRTEHPTVPPQVASGRWEGTRVRWGSPCVSLSLGITGPALLRSSPRRAQRLSCSVSPPQGDSGGPLVCGKDQVLAGVLSFSSRVCTDVFRPPVATAVAPYVSWIRKVTS
uniref:Peptidase S1 domain-containing protein n=1 Tax=Colobus angolensis palliatus TaxID=336983 RepID=A0A2K5HVI5_COLAP